jgi:xylulokinase
MFVGIDLGTSSVKVVLVDSDQRVVDHESVPLQVQRPRPLWSEQDPESWWGGTARALDALKLRRAGEMSEVRGIGLSGQMHGATLLDERDRILRPAILWNDGRSAPQCAELERREPRSREITGNLAMPGFTAPKLIWVEQNEPEIFHRTRRVLLPKDYLRWRLSGEYASDMSDAAGTLWLDVAGRRWSGPMLDASHLPMSAMPGLFEGTEQTGRILPELAERWGMDRAAVIAGGGGDNAASAVGAGVVAPGQAFLSLGTSGVLFVVNEAFRPNPERAVHAFCHAVPCRWHQMSVNLSAASCVSWASKALGASSEGALLDEVEAAADSPSLLFLPYLSGERTPHNDVHAKGSFIGLTHATSRAALGRAVLEGVAFAFADGLDVLKEAGAAIDCISVVGGGSRSALWGRILASALDHPLQYHAGGEVGGAFGAARLARLALTGEDAADVCSAPPIDRVVEPDPALAGIYRDRRRLYSRAYASLRELFPALS